MSETPVISNCKKSGWDCLRFSAGQNTQQWCWLINVHVLS